MTRNIKRKCEENERYFYRSFCRRNEKGNREDEILIFLTQDFNIYILKKYMIPR